jgi:hypothetical protein
MDVARALDVLGGSVQRTKRIGKRRYWLWSRKKVLGELLSDFAGF